MKIFLFRHGEKQKVKSSEYDIKTSVLLTPRGIEEVSKLGDYLFDKYKELIGANHLYSSPFPRAVQTAEIIRARLKIKEFKTEQSLREYYAFNDYSRPKEYSKKLQEKALIDPDFKSPETCKSMNDLITNTMRFFDLQLKDGVENLIISSHGGLIRNIVYNIDKSYRPKDEEILDSKIAHAGLTILKYSASSKSVEYFNLHHYL